jgi:hypothetical protein
MEITDVNVKKGSLSTVMGELAKVSWVKIISGDLLTVVTVNQIIQMSSISILVDNNRLDNS